MFKQTFGSLLLVCLLLVYSYPTYAYDANVGEITVKNNCKNYKIHVFNQGGPMCEVLGNNWSPTGEGLTTEVIMTKEYGDNKRSCSYLVEPEGSVSISFWKSSAAKLVVFDKYAVAHTDRTVVANVTCGPKGSGCDCNY